jgi:hypothetical protein
MVVSFVDLWLKRIERKHNRYIVAWKSEKRNDMKWKNHGEKCKKWRNAIILDGMVYCHGLNGFWRKQND